jgi:hypothetical protein
MTEEDEAFEDLAKRQGDWGMQGSRKHQIMRYAENVENKGTSMTDKEAMAMALEALTYKKWWRVGLGEPKDPKLEAAITALRERLAQPEQEPVAWEQFYQRIEQNFCSRCGKRTPDLITIHTCTPPQENT